MKLSKMIALLCAAALLCAGCTAQGIPAGNSASGTEQPTPIVSPARNGVSTTDTKFFFDTVVTVRLYDATDGLMDEIWKACGVYEAMLSKTVEGSDVWRINHAEGQPVQVSEETWEILQLAKRINAISDHALSITLAPVISLWDFTGGSERMPTDEERLAALALVDDEKLVLGDDRTVTLPAGMSIDLGGVAKGFIADKIAELVTGRVSGAVLNLGGNVYVVGLKPDGSEFRIGVRDPDGTESDSIAVVTTSDRTVVTSGIYERYFCRDGIRYHHILDPETGISAMNDLASATIIGVSSLEADAIATVCMVMGSEKALAFLNQHQYDGILIRQDREILLTDNFPYTIKRINQS